MVNVWLFHYCKVWFLSRNTQDHVALTCWKVYHSSRGTVELLRSSEGTASSSRIFDFLLTKVFDPWMNASKYKLWPECMRCVVNQKWRNTPRLSAIVLTKHIFSNMTLKIWVSCLLSFQFFICYLNYDVMQWMSFIVHSLYIYVIITHNFYKISLLT